MNFEIEDEFWSREVSVAWNQLKHLQQIRKTITRNLRYAQIIQQKYYNKKHYLRKFYKRDFVLLNVKNLQIIKFSKKLSHKYIRPFHIEESVKTQTYCLSLSTSYWIYSIFHVFLLKLYKNRNGESEIYMSENITVDDHEKYEIEEILNRKNAKSELWYKMKWLEWSQKYNQ